MNRTHPILNRSKVAVVLLLLAICAYAQAQESQKPQQPEDVVRVYTDLVQTDVMVFDKQGRFVSGLKREDFALRIDGKSQPIDFLDLIDAGSATEEVQLAAAQGTSPGNASVTPKIERGRTILFYVDDFHLSPGDLTLLRRALLKFIDDDLGQNDEAVITSASGQIGFLQQLTGNQAVLHAAVSRIKALPYGVQDRERPLMTEYQALLIDRNPATVTASRFPGAIPDLLSYFVERTMIETGETRESAEIHVRGRARAILQQAASITTRTLSGFESLVKSSSELPGRKLAFFISDGFFVDTGNSDAPQRVENIISTAAHNSVVVYSMDSRALTTGLPSAGDQGDVDPFGILARESRGELSASRDAMTLMAVDTGGRPIMDTNALDVGLANAVKETSQYYVLGWHTNHDAEINRKKSRIELTLPGHPNLTARLGKSLRAPASVKKQPKKDESKTAKSPEAKLQETLVRALPSKQLPVSLDLVYQRADKAALLKTSIQVPIESLSFNNEEEKQKALIQVAALIYNDQGKVVQQFNKRMMLAAATANGVVSTDDSFTFKYEVPLPAGLYQVRAGIHDERSGRTGTAHEWIEIPNLLAPTLTLSSVISAEVSPHAANQTSPITLRANHHFRRDSSLRFLIYIYDPQLGQTDSKPDLVMQLQIFRDRQAAVTTPLRVISTTGFEALNEIPFEADLPLEQLAPGRYLMRVTVVDRANKMSASQQMRIEID